MNIQLRNKRYLASKDKKKDVTLISQLSNDEAKDALEVLKSMLVTENNMDEFKRLLATTLEYRQSKLKSEEELDLQENFPYFFVSTDLVRCKTLVQSMISFYSSRFYVYIQVSHDFLLRFPNAETNTFADWWENHSSRMMCVLKNHHKQTHHSLWPEQIHDLLVFFKLLPTKAKGSTLLSIHAFKKSISKLIIFRQVNSFNAFI